MSGAGRVIRLGDQVATVLSEGTSVHDVAVVDTLLPPGAGTPLHRHHGHEEAFYLVAGTVEMVLGEVRTVGEPGRFVLAERGVAHAFRNIGTTDARLLAIYAPSSAIAYLDDLAGVIASGGAPEELTAFYARHASEVA